VRKLEKGTRVTGCRRSGWFLSTIIKNLHICKVQLQDCELFWVGLQ